MTRNLVIRPLIETQNPNTESLGSSKIFHSEQQA